VGKEGAAGIKDWLSVHYVTGKDWGSGKPGNTEIKEAISMPLTIQSK
jgi:hypothetical protein